MWSAHHRGDGPASSDLGVRLDVARGRVACDHVSADPDAPVAVLRVEGPARVAGLLDDATGVGDDRELAAGLRAHLGGDAVRGVSALLTSRTTAVAVVVVADVCGACAHDRSA